MAIDMKYIRAYVCDMKTAETKRSYTMSARADQVARNDQRIINAFADLWLELPLAELTLEKVAEKSGVSVRTILRKYGSKEGLIKSSIESAGSRLTNNRMKVIPGDLPGIVDVLLEEYELMGDANIRTLTVEFDYPSTAELLSTARSFHRKWCEKVFEPFLPKSLSDSYETILMSFIAATEFYLWKLMRKDLGKSTEQTRQIFLYILECLAKQNQTKRT